MGLQIFVAAVALLEKLPKTTHDTSSSPEADQNRKSQHASKPNCGDVPVKH